MRYLFISIVLILSSGCKLSLVDDFTESDTWISSIHNPYFSNSELDYVYKMEVAVYGNEFSGILIVKKIEQDTHRMVFTSQFGSTFFDIEFNAEGYKINTIIDELNRKIILNTLIRDFSLLLKENDTVTGRYHNKNYNVLKAKSDKRSNYYFYTLPDAVLSKIVQTTKSKEKFEIIYDKVSENHVAESIKINHKNIKLNIELNLLKK
ncbi:hypothetical protein [Aquimarina sp. MMG016]|uniref:hypothetical protein n=1 Tax=Aquimarina sp. MMG016 TaxID=2822690 RepID=UPI001B3A597C|nr:hypothetical protein [Aquimarina sp. MMG016]MBQ4821347.1 hypothetical protein [Aquimarina sp. MMG016]